MSYLYIKALHIIFIVTWFAGLFYMVRLFIYTTEANEKPEPDRSILIKQLLLMQNRLWFIISWPSAIITFVLGFWLLYILNYWSQPWMHLKLLFVFGLYIYQFICHSIYKKMNDGIFKYSSTQFRIWNELATIFLFAIVFIIVLKNTLSWIWGLTGLIGVGIILMLGIRLYKKLRQKKND